MPDKIRSPLYQYAVTHLLLGKNHSWLLADNQGASESNRESLTIFLSWWISLKKILFSVSFLHHIMPNSPEHCLFLIQALEPLALLVMVCEVWPTGGPVSLSYWIGELSHIWALCVQALRQALCNAQLFISGQRRSCLKQNSRTFRLTHRQLAVSPWPHTIPLRHRTQQWRWP